MNAEPWVFWTMLINGFASWGAAILTIMAIATVFKKSDWILQTSLAVQAASLIVLGTSMLLQGWLQYSTPEVSTASAIFLKLSGGSVMVWFMAAYYKEGRFCRLESTTLRLSDAKSIFTGIWNDERKEPKLAEMHAGNLIGSRHPVGDRT